MNTPELIAELEKLFPEMDKTRIAAFANGAAWIPQDQEKKLMKTQTDTPETDAEEIRYDDINERKDALHYFVPADHARKLERERDAALRELADLRKDYKVYVASNSIRESLLAIPDRLAASLVGSTDEARVRQSIDLEVRNSLQSLVVTMGDDATAKTSRH